MSMEKVLYLSTNAAQSGKSYKQFSEFLARAMEIYPIKLNVEFTYPELLDERRKHEAILAGVNNQLQACARQIDQFQSKLCEQDEALSVAVEALEKISKHTCYRIGCGDVGTLESELAKEAKQKIEEILTKENENEEN